MLSFLTSSSHRTRKKLITIKELESGVKLIVDKIDSVRSVSLGIWCGSGSKNELPNEEGISHLIEHMLFKGTPTRNAYQIVQEMESIGAEINAFTSKQRTCFYAKCIDENIYKAAEVLTDMVEHPLFDEKELEREKLVVIEEINMNADDPDDVAMDKFDEVVLEGTKLSHPVLGSKETVSSFNHDTLDKYYKEHYTRDNIVISISGNFDEDRIVEYFNNKFLNLGIAKREDKFGELTGRVDYIRIEKDIEQAHLVIGTTTVSANDPRRYHLSVLSMIMGGGMSSRLFQNVREKKGLAYSVYSSNSFYENTGEFGIVAGVAKNRVDEAIEAIKEEINKLNNESIEIEEFETAKAQLKSSLIFSLENTQSRMRNNGLNYFNFGYCPDQTDTLSIIDAIIIDELETSKKLISDWSKYTIINVTGKC